MNATTATTTSRGEHVAGDREVVRDALPLVADLVSDRGEGARVDDGADEVEDLEAPEGHLGRPGDDRRERAHDGHGAADRHGELPPARQPALGAVEIPRGEEDVPAETFDERPASDPSDTEGGRRPGELGHDAHAEHEREIQPARRGEHAGEPERDLRRDRHAAGLGEGEKDERGVARFSEEVLHAPSCTRPGTAVLPPGGSRTRRR